MTLAPHINNRKAVEYLETEYDYAIGYLQKMTEYETSTEHHRNTVMRATWSDYILWSDRFEEIMKTSYPYEFTLSPGLFSIKGDHVEKLVNGESWCVFCYNTKDLVVIE